MHTGICRSVIDKHLTILISYPAIGKSHIHHVAKILVALRNEEEATRTGNNLCWVVKGGHIHIQHIAQTISRGTHTMSQVQPALGGLDGMRALTILHLGDGVVFAFVDNLLFLDFSMGDVVDQCPANAATRTRIDKAILRTGIEGILAIHKFRVQHDVALLRLCLQVGQAVPRLQVLGTCNTGRCRCGTEIARLRVVVALSTEDTINPAVFMGGETHVVDIRSRNDIVGHGDGLIPETEVVDAIG